MTAMTKRIHYAEHPHVKKVLCNQVAIASGWSVLATNVIQKVTCEKCKRLLEEMKEE